MATLRENCCGVVEDIVNGDGKAIARICAHCLSVVQSLCPVCDGWYRDARRHQRLGYGVCGHFMDRGKFSVGADAIASVRALKRAERFGTPIGE